MIVRELVTRLGFSVQDSNLKKYEQGVNNIKSSAENAANSFRSMFAAFVGFSAIKSIANTADQMQSMQARIGMLPQTIGEAGDAFDVVGNRATAARQSIDAYGNLYIKLQNAGKDFIKTQAEGLQVTDTLSKALVVGGASAQEQSSAMLQFAQAIGSGVLQGDELRAMGEAAPQFMDELAKAIGVPRDQIKKMGSDGKLTSKMVIEAVKKMSSVFDDKFKQMPMTISQAITIGGNKWDMFVNRLNQKSGAVTSVANFLLAGFDKLESGLNKMVDFFGGATQTIKLFGIVLLAAFGPAIIGIIVGGFVAIFSVAGLLFGGLVLLGLVLEDLYQYFNDGESVIGDWIDEINNGNEAMKIFGAVVIGVLSGIALRLVATAATSAAVWAINGAAAVASWAVATASSIAATASMIASFVAMAASAIWAGTQMAVAWVIGLGPIGLIIAAIIGLIAIFVYFKDDVLKWMSGLWKSITAGFFSMIDSIKNAWANFKSFFTSGVNANVTATTVAGSNNPNGPMGGARSFGQNVTIHQTLPPGSTPETAAAAKGATMEAMKATDNGQLSRQMGQAQ